MLWDRIGWCVSDVSCLPEPLEPVIPKICVVLIWSLNGSNASWVAVAKHPGLAMFFDFFIS